MGLTTTGRGGGGLLSAMMSVVAGSMVWMPGSAGGVVW